MGPIRIRALHKAGLTSILDIKAASLDALRSVRGITEIKAAYIHEFLAGFTFAQLKEASASSEAKPASTSATLVQWDHHSIAVDISPVSLEAARAMGAVIKLLTSPHTPQLRNRLVSGLERLGLECQGLILEAVPVYDQETEKILRRLRKLTESLISIAKQPEFDKKEQGRTADELNETFNLVAAIRVASAARQKARTKDTRDG